MRARLALWSARVKVEIREVVLRDKPASMLKYSPKGTVPVLILQDGTVIDESRDIIHWALKQNDPDGWKRDGDSLIDELIDENDSSFKENLDRYKYTTRFPEEPLEVYRHRGEEFLHKLETNLHKHKFLIDEQVSLADIAIFPFVRQFAYVDIKWFEQSQYKKVQQWLNHFLNSDLFHIMSKYTKWEEGQEPIFN